jgi:hypothetical protein
MGSLEIGQGNLDRGRNEAAFEIFMDLVQNELSDDALYALTKMCWDGKLNAEQIEKFYEQNHKSQALQITELIMKDFDKNARIKGLILILTIIPTCRDFEHKKIYGYFPYKNLPKELNKYSFFFIDFGLEIIENGLNYKDLYFNCSSHMNKIGNQALAEIFERKLKEMQLY